MAAATFEEIKKQLAERRFAPVYVLSGEEGYYIDELVKLFEQIIPEEERAFNMYTFYAPQTPPQRILDCCMSVPMMAEHQLVIVKEAQADLATRINRLHTYVANPQPSTILVICFRGDKAKGKDLLAAARKNAVMFESKRLSDYKIGAAIEAQVRRYGLSAQPRALEMLREFIGNDLSRMANEIEKLAGILGPNATVTPEAVERYIGVSKEYNSFEMVDALAARDAAKAYRIARYMAANPKAIPVQSLSATLFGFFSKLLIVYYTPDKSESSLMKALDLKWPLELRRYRTAMSRYNAFHTIEIIDAIRTFDAQSKGIGSRTDGNMLLTSLIHRILTSTGRLPV